MTARAKTRTTGIALASLLVLALLPGAARAAAADWRPYEDPTGLVTIDVPGSWRPGKATESPPSCTSVAFRLPGGGALTLSVTEDVPPGERTLVKSLARYFPDDVALEVPHQTRTKQWFAVRQDATGSIGGKPSTWLGQFYLFGSTLVGLTLSDSDDRIDDRRDDFERVVKSVRYHLPPVDTVRRDGAAGPGAPAATFACG